jgi:glutathione synthase/RimK-type ligase-like ATP-grasp enzyme
MNILIIGKAKITPNQEIREYYDQYVRFFENSTKTVGIGDAIVNTSLLDDYIIKVGDDKFSIYDTKNEHDLNWYDVIFLRGQGFKDNMGSIASICEYADSYNIPVVNDYHSVRDSSKLLQAVNFYKLGIPVAKTMLVNSAVLTHVRDWEFPCVMKAVNGSHGNDNYIVKDMDEVRDIATKHNNLSFILQRFVPNNGDYRVLVAGDDYMTIRRSSNSDSHLNNTSQGGSAELIDNETLPAEILNDSRKIMQHYGMRIAGVDVIVDKNTGDPYFLEVNSQPQLMTGACLSQKETLIGNLIKTLVN